MISTSLPTAIRKITTRKTVRERFFEKAEFSKTRSYNGTPCLEWKAGRYTRGYGKFKLNGRHDGAHRVAMMLENVEIGNSCVLHRCDNPPCVNTDHLFLGTQADNMADMDMKGRRARGEKHGKVKLKFKVSVKTAEVVNEA
jgi:hypothetical protein